MELFSGSAVALVTPFADGKVDFPALEALIEAQIAARTDAIVVLGTTGEPSTLLPEERREIIACAKERIGAQAQLIVGAGANCTRTAVGYAEEAEALGADAILVVTPYYNKASEEGLLRHFTAVAEAVSLPVILYNVPGRTGVNLSPELAARLLEHPRIRGIKEASGSIAQISRLAELMGECAALYAGNDSEILPVLALGGRGVISVAANIVPAEVKALTTAWQTGKAETARALQLRLLALTRALFAEVNPIPVKAALSLMGRIRNELRLPLCQLEGEALRRLASVLSAYGLLS